MSKYFFFIFSNIGKFDDYTPLYITQLDKFTAEVQDFPYQGDREIPVVISNIFAEYKI